jgi:hypothetical protein
MERKRQISPQALGSLLHVSAGSIKTHFKLRPGKKQFSEEQAIEAIRRYLPLALGWKTVAGVARRIGEHRNTVERLVKVFGKPGMLMLAPDCKMYISRRGEQIVHKKKRELGHLSSYQLLSDVARELGVRSFVVQDYFKVRKIEVQRDLQGRLRLTPEHVQDLIRWREIVKPWRNKDDIVVDGAVWRSISTVAQDKAGLLEPLGTERHVARQKQEEAALRWFRSFQSKSRRVDKLGQYVPEGLAAIFSQTIRLVDAAELCMVSTSTIKGWRSKYPELTPAGILGKKTFGVWLPALLQIAAKKYATELKYTKRSAAPAALIALPLQKIATAARVDYRALVASLDQPAKVKNALLSKQGGIPRAACASMTRQFFGAADPNKAAESFWGATQYLLQVVGARRILGSPVCVQAAVERAAFTRGESATVLYESATKLFGLRTPWPQTFEELKDVGEQGPFFPLVVLGYLNTLMEKKVCTGFFLWC